MSAREQESLHWLPMPEADTRSRKIWKSFEDLYCRDHFPTDADCPSTSAAHSSSQSSSQLPFECTSTRIRSFICCTECDKPRLLYAKQALNEDEAHEVEAIKDEFLYSCGGPLFPENHDMTDRIIVKPGLTCVKPVSLQYYSAMKREVLDGAVDVCFHCASRHVLMEEELALRHVSWASRCADCKAANRSSSRRRQRAGQQRGRRRGRGRRA